MKQDDELAKAGLIATETRRVSDLPIGDTANRDCVAGNLVTKSQKIASLTRGVPAAFTQRSILPGLVYGRNSNRKSCRLKTFVPRWLR